MSHRSVNETEGRARRPATGTQPSALQPSHREPFTHPQHVPARECVTAKHAPDAALKPEAGQGARGGQRCPRRRTGYEDSRSLRARSDASTDFCCSEPGAQVVLAWPASRPFPRPTRLEPRTQRRVSEQAGRGLPAPPLREDVGTLWPRCRARGWSRSCVATQAPGIPGAHTGEPGPHVTDHRLYPPRRPRTGSGSVRWFPSHPPFPGRPAPHRLPALQ